MKEKQKRLVLGVTVFLLLISVAVLYITHKEIPFMMDDLWYSTMLFSEEPITSLSDIVESQIWHYHNWGGRSITHGMLQITLLLGERITDILNVLMVFALSFMVCNMAGSRKLPWLFGAMGMLLGLNANWKMSMFWQAGAANYLYITVFILGFLYCYLREVELTEAARKLPGISLWIVPLGLISGWSNENMGPAVWVITLIVMGLCAKEKKKIPLWMIWGSVSSLIGSVLVVAAPGNFVRSEQVASNNYGVLWNIFLRCYAESRAALDYLFAAVLILLVVLFIGKGILQIPIGGKTILLMVCALLSWGAMILSPHYPDRATFGTLVLLICAVLSVVKDILQKRKDLGVWFFAAAILIWLRGMYFLGEFLGMCWEWIV